MSETRWKWNISDSQWACVVGWTAYLGLAGAQAGNPWIGLLSFPVWYTVALIGRNT